MSTLQEQLAAACERVGIKGRAEYCSVCVTGPRNCRFYNERHKLIPIPDLIAGLDGWIEKQPKYTGRSLSHNPKLLLPWRGAYIFEDGLTPIIVDAFAADGETAVGKAALAATKKLEGEG